MRTLHVTGLALAIAAGFALPLAGSAEAAMGGALPSTQVLPVEQAQFFFLGHNFCWYDDGWQGPGWYWCNYAWRSGYGWGGGDGWHGWNRGQWHHNRGPVVPAPYIAPRSRSGPPPQRYFTPQNKIGPPPQHYAPHNNFVPGSNIKGGAFPGGAGVHGPAAHGAPLMGAGPKGGHGPGACQPGQKGC